MKYDNKVKMNAGSLSSPESFAYFSTDDRRQSVELARHIARRDWVLFAGSGVSHNSGLPLWKDLADEMIRRLGSKEEDTQDPLELASLFETSLGRDALVRFLRENLEKPDLYPNPLHNLLLDLRPPTIVTTNFDDLFERALQQKEVPYACVINNADLSLVGDRLQVLKPHGDLAFPDSLVFTRRDYSRYPQQEIVNEKLRTLAAQHSFLFVGYSLNDPDLNHQFQHVLDAQQPLARHHYLVVDKISALKRKALLAERQVHVIALGSYDHLEQFLIELQTEAEKIRASERKVPFVPTTGRAELVPLSEAEKQVVLLLEEDYQPVIEAFEHLRFVDAEKHLHALEGINGS